MQLLRIITIFLLFSLVLTFSACEQKAEVSFPRIAYLPEIVGAEMHFRGYVTDTEDELVSDISEFTRVVSHRDTINYQPLLVYISQQQKTPYYTDGKGTVREYVTDEIGLRVVQYGFAFRDPISVSYWKPVLKLDEGVGTEWSVSVDTTFEMITLKGGKNSIRYVHSSRGRFEGWSEVYVPESPKTRYKVLETYWPEVRTTIENLTTGEVLFSSRGWARQYFEPSKGCIKYITDFTKYDKDNPEEVSLKGSWELLRTHIPN